MGGSAPPARRCRPRAPFEWREGRAQATWERGGARAASAPSTPHWVALQDRTVEPRAARVRGRQADALHAASVFWVGQETTRVGDGVRAGRDQPAVRADRRQNGPRMAG